MCTAHQRKKPVICALTAFLFILNSEELSCTTKRANDGKKQHNLQPNSKFWTQTSGPAFWLFFLLPQDISHFGHFASAGRNAHSREETNPQRVVLISKNWMGASLIRNNASSCLQCLNLHCAFQAGTTAAESKSRGPQRWWEQTLVVRNESYCVFSWRINAEETDRVLMKCVADWKVRRTRNAGIRSTSPRRTPRVRIARRSWQRNLVFSLFDLVHVQTDKTVLATWQLDKKKSLMRVSISCCPQTQFPRNPTFRNQTKARRAVQQTEVTIGVRCQTFCNCTQWRISRQNAETRSGWTRTTLASDKGFTTPLSTVSCRVIRLHSRWRDALWAGYGSLDDRHRLRSARTSFVARDVFKLIHGYSIQRNCDQNVMFAEYLFWHWSSVQPPLFRWSRTPTAMGGPAARCSVSRSFNCHSRLFTRAAHCC